MSGGPPHHSHGRQAPSPNTAWNHLQVPNYYPRQPQHAHMSNEHPLLHQSTWHTPTTEPVKTMPHPHLFNLEQMISERPYPRHSPGVDLSLQKNGNQNGELPSTPISLSVRDANKINSLPVSAVDMQAVELTKSVSPGLKSVKSNSPVLKLFSPSSPSHPIKPPISPNISSSTFDKQDSPKTLKRPIKRMDSIIERLNPVLDKDRSIDKRPSPERTDKHSVIVQPLPCTNTTTEDASNRASSTHKEDDVTSPYSNDDSMDSSKSRRKRKPAKTIRVSKDIEALIEPEVIEIKNINIEENLSGELKEQRSDSAPPSSPSETTSRTRRKTSSESETIANIAAMIEMTDPEKNVKNEDIKENDMKIENNYKPISVSVIKTQDKEDPVSSPVVIQTPAQKKMTETNCFVEVENKLEEMFAGITDDNDDSPKMSLDYDDSKTLGLEESRIEEEEEKSNDCVASTSRLNDNVTSTSNDLNTQNSHKRARQKSIKARRSSESASEFFPKKKKANKKLKITIDNGKNKNNSKKSKGKNLIIKPINKVDSIKDVYAYDSGSNASSSRSRGPFIQIRGPRESPISVNVVNTPTYDEDSEKKVNKSKKYHDDTEYRHKVRSRGLHCSTLSNKYDAQTRDATWICVFCKRGPHATDPNLAGPSRFNINTLIPPPGDLFGPYIIMTDSAEYQRRLDDPFDKQFKSKKVARALNAVGLNKVSPKKSKRKHSDSYDSRSSFEGVDANDIYLGITETQDKVYEVWAHENCIVWSPGVYLVGPKIIGLEEAVWTSCNVVCHHCRYKGANLCCIKRGCTSVVHVGCAYAADWFLDEDNYKALCTEHKTP